MKSLWSLSVYPDCLNDLIDNDDPYSQKSENPVLKPFVNIDQRFDEKSLFTLLPI